MSLHRQKREDAEAPYLSSLDSKSGILKYSKRGIQVMDNFIKSPVQDSYKRINNSIRANKGRLEGSLLHRVIKNNELKVTLPLFECQHIIQGQRMKKKSSKLISHSVRESSDKSQEFLKVYNRKSEGVSTISPTLTKGIDNYIKDNYYENLYEEFQRLNTKKSNPALPINLRIIPFTNRKKRAVMASTINMKDKDESNEAKSSGLEQGQYSHFKGMSINKKMFLKTKANQEELAKSNKLSSKQDEQFLEEKKSPLKERESMEPANSLCKRNSNSIALKSRNSYVPKLVVEGQHLSFIAKSTNIKGYCHKSSNNNKEEFKPIKVLNNPCCVAIKDNQRNLNESMNALTEKQFSKIPKKRGLLCCF